MNRYKKLFSDTIIFAIGNFLVKLFQFLLMPLYTSAMTTSEYGVAELLNNTTELLYPIITLGIYEAVFRFVLDKDSDHRQLLSNGLAISFLGIGFTFLVALAVQQFIHYEYLYYLLLVLFSMSLRMVVAQYARGVGRVVSFSISGVVNVLGLFLSNVILLTVCHAGVYGYLISLAVGNFLSILYLFLSCRMWRDLTKPRFGDGTIKQMLLYSLPLIPNMLSWWITNLSGRYIVLFFCGAGMAGMFAAASKLPSIVNMVASIFQQAWQISSAQALGDKTGPKYFSKVFRVYASFVFLTCSFVIVAIPIIAKILLQGEFYQAWVYIPLLILSSCLNCFSTYFGTLYNAAKQNRMIFVSTLIGAIVNLIFAVILTMTMGILGTCIASVLSYLIIVVIRIWDTQKIVKVNLYPRYMLINFGMLLIQAILMMTAQVWCIIIAVILFLCMAGMMFFVYIKEIKLLCSKLKRKICRH